MKMVLNDKHQLVTTYLPVEGTPPKIYIFTNTRRLHLIRSKLSLLSSNQTEYNQNNYFLLSYNLKSMSTCANYRYKIQYTTCTTSGPIMLLLDAHWDRPNVMYVVSKYVDAEQTDREAGRALRYPAKLLLRIKANAAIGWNISLSRIRSRSIRYISGVVSPPPRGAIWEKFRSDIISSVFLHNV